MASLTSTILSILIALFAGAVAFAWYTDTLKPIVVYYYTYVTEGQKSAEEKALDMMGESKLSYGLKDQLKRNKIIDNDGLNDVQDTLADTLGGQLGKGGLGEGLGKGLSKNL
ncbi:MAG: hypothetical protein M1816_000982 [Peltula sp. TS41687]|nr:MAG: hypothetical protein M1816_000982 [Peltula sp. TS41687]